MSSLSIIPDNVVLALNALCILDAYVRPLEDGLRRGGFGQWNDTRPWDGNGHSHSYRPMNWGKLIN